MGTLTRTALAALVALAQPTRAEPVDQWMVHIHEAAKRFGLPAAWVRDVIRAESSGATRLNGAPVRSRAGAMGLMQLMPGTWREMRATLRLGGDPDDPRDNILAGTLYLRLMYDRFGYPGLFAAYNAGPERYSAHLAGRRRLPTETRVYVAKLVSHVPREPARRRRSVGRLAVAARKISDPGILFDRSGGAGLFVALTTAPR